jgi:hypothetical protein
VVKKSVSLAVIFGLVFQTVAIAFAQGAVLASPAGDASPIPPEAISLAEHSASNFAKLAVSIDAKYFEVNALADALDYDFDAAIAHVTKSIAYDSYLGVLRGPEGTIAAQAGSAWDQAALLASLLKSMGADAMVVTGTLLPDDSKRLLAETLRVRDAMPQLMNSETLLKEFEGTLNPAALAELQNSLHTDQKTFSKNDKAFAGSIEAASQSLLAALKKSGLEWSAADSQKITAQLQQRIAEDYAWVQYRGAPREQWQNIHPAFAGQTPPEVNEQAIYAEEIPVESTHQVEIRLELERTYKGSINREQIMEAYRRPTANLAKQQTPIHIAPSGDAAEGAENAQLFLPALYGELAPGAKAFNLMGQAVTATDAFSGPQIFATVSGKLGSAMEGLDSAFKSDSQESSLPRLTGIILSVDWVSPDGIVHSQERRLVDFRQEKPENAAQKIIFEGVIDVGLGLESGGRHLKSAFTTLAKRLPTLPYYVALSRGDISLQQLLDDPKAQTPHTPMPWLEMATLREGFEAVSSDTQRTVRTGPLVVMRRIKQSGGRAIAYIDVLHNPSIVLEKNGAEARLSQEGALRQGVRETVYEHILIRGGLDNPWFQSPIATVLESQAEVAASIALRNFSQSVQERLYADFTESGLLFLSDSEGYARWWRVDPVSGQTLGMGLDGGVELTESQVLKINVAMLVIGGTFAIIGARDCTASYKDNPKMELCCHAGNALLFGVGVGAGSAVGGVVESTLKNAWKATLGYFTAMLSSEISINITNMYGSGTVANAVCKAALDG